MPEPAERVRLERAFARAVGDCFDCYCAEEMLNEEGQWTGEHEDECNREAAYESTLFALEKLQDQWSVVQLIDGTPT